LASIALLLFFLHLTELPLHAQTAAATKGDAASIPSISLDVLVLGLPKSGLRDIGLFFPESDPAETGNATGFAIVIPGEEARTLAGNPHAILVHRLKEQTANPARVRLDARTPTNPDDPAVQPYYEASIRLEVTSRAVSSRSIVLSTSSAVQIRRGPAAAGGLAALLLETQPVKHDLQVQEGKTILLGGFFSAEDRSRLPNLPAPPESPLLSYVLSKAPRQGQDTEIVILLTPHRIGGTTEPAPVITAVPAIVPRAIIPPAPPDPPVVEVAETKSNTPGVASMASLLAPPPVLASMSPSPTVSKPDLPFFTVQAGAFQSRAHADTLAAKLEKEFEDVYVDESGGGKTPYRVRVGRLPNLTSAKGIRSKLANAGIESFIVTPEVP
jgi:hypothetical protein